MGIYGHLLEEYDGDLKSNSVEKLYSSFNQKVEIDNDKKIFIIKGINYNKFLLRLKEMYKYKKIMNLFQKEYTLFSLMLYKFKKISKDELKISELHVHLFFALEMYRICLDLYEFYNLPFYKNLANMIYKKTWINKYESIPDKFTDVSNLSLFKYQLKDYQIEYIRQYTNRKNKYETEGDVLVFKQGLGKTLTSIGLSECLNKKQIVIVCPNSLKENWAYEIRDYYKKYSNDLNSWKNDVYISNNEDFNKYKKAKFFIVNMESIDKIYPVLDKSKDSIIIVDECHNFRNNDSKRTQQLLKLKELLNCKDNLMMSGTPTKATPDEIVPVLRMIDPYFTEELANIYIKTFSNSSIEIARVVKERFNRILYIKTKEEVLNLPEKIIEDLYLPIKHPELYSIKYIRSLVLEEFEKIYKQKFAEIEKYRQEFESMIYQYSSANYKETREYLEYVYMISNPNSPQKTYHDIDIENFKNFLKDYVYPNITSNDEVKRLKFLITNYMRIYESAMGTAIGAVLPKAKNDVYIAILNENITQIKTMIESNAKKTVIFTPFLKVADEAYNILTKNNIGCVKIVGGTKNRMDLIQQFKNDDSIDVIIATTKTLSTGVTLTEANQMFFFGVDYREADFEQACDRIHRIGQTSKVNIYTVLLYSSEKNITERINDIMNWSGEMSNSILY